MKDRLLDRDGLGTGRWFKRVVGRRLRLKISGRVDGPPLVPRSRTRRSCISSDWTQGEGEDRQTALNRERR